MTRAWLVWAAVLAGALPASAQDAPTFISGPLAWSPVLALRDFGWDSNVLDSADEPVADFVATLAPEFDAALNTARLRLSGTGGLDLVYYERLRDQRAASYRYGGRVEVPLNVLVPFVAGARRGASDQTAEIDTPSRHRDDDLSAGVLVTYGARMVVQLAARRQTVRYDPGSFARGVELAQALNRGSENLTAAVRFAATPLTSLVADGSVTRDHYALSASKDQRDLRGTIAVEFAPDAIIRGRATFGYHALEVADPSAVDYRGPTFDVDLTYVLLERTRFNARYRRDTTASVEAPYYVDDSYGGEVTQAFIGPTELVGRYNRQTSHYPGIPARAIAPRFDVTDRYIGGLTVRMTETTRMTFTYERVRRRSIIEGLTYLRNRVLTSVSLGF